jgi:hypothetical protein
MPLELIPDPSGISISYDHDLQWQYMNWQGMHTRESSRECCLLALEAMWLRPAPDMLNNNSGTLYTCVQLTEWLL